MCIRPGIGQWMLIHHTSFDGDVLAFDGVLARFAPSRDPRYMGSV
jgi:hypothetical protein